ncbi:MAG: cation diffusion facilitator family transporter [Actinomycetota bacterium]|nr:cation diffusion facilitator family transporter [Actinomycetota bacterium]
MVDEPAEHEDHVESHDHNHDHEHPNSILARIGSIFIAHSHDTADSFDSALESSAAGIRAVKLSLLALLITSAVQATVVVLTSSVALLADAIHNLSDALTAIPLWIAFSLSRRPATRRYTYGFGRAEDLAGIFIILMIALSAGVAGYESLRRLLNPQEVSYLGAVMAAGIIGFAGNELVAIYRIRVGRRIGSAALVADGLHARTDAITSLAVVIGAFGVLIGFPAADPIVGLLVTFAILIVLWQAMRDIYRRLMDATDPELIDEVEAALSKTPGIVGIDKVQMRWVGHRLHVEIAISADPNLSLIAAHDIAHEAEHELLHGIARIDEVQVHVGPNETKGPEFHGVIEHHRG